MSGLGTFGFEYRPRNDGRLVLATTRTHGSEQVEKAIAKTNPSEVVRVGGAGHKALLVLEGKLEPSLSLTALQGRWMCTSSQAQERRSGTPARQRQSSGPLEGL